jgi:hypothetical protein
MNIVIPFRNTCGTNELQMCVKLINKNMQDYFNLIYVVGDEIDFIDSSVINIKVKEQKYNKWLDSSFLVDYYIKNISNESFILFNDDFFITSPICAEDLKYYYFETLNQRIKTTYVIEPKTGVLRLSAYGLNIQRFIDLFGDCENYEVHIPMPILYPEVMSQAIEETKEYDCPALKRTYYMKLLADKHLVSGCSKAGLPHDIKFGEPLRIMQYPFFSLTDTEYKAFEKDFEKMLSE